MARGRPRCEFPVYPSESSLTFCSTGPEMPITNVHSYLVRPAKNAVPQPPVSGTAVPRSGALFEMLGEVFDRAPNECDVQIVFAPDDQGLQNNDARDSIEAYARNPTVALGRGVAERLQRVTTHRSGLGLLFLLKGTDGAGRHSLVISRFPADQGVVALEQAASLSVEFLERVFMKNAKAYKSALYSTDSLAAGFPDGLAVDRQLSGPRDLSEYWISAFLESELRTTGPAGSRRLAEALRMAVNATSSSDLKQELVSAARLMRGQDGRTRSARTILRRLGMSEEATAAIENAFPRPELTLSANVRETRSTQRIRVGRRQRKRTCWDCEREWKRMVVPLEPGRPSEARQLLRTRR